MNSLNQFRFGRGAQRALILRHRRGDDVVSHQARRRPEGKEQTGDRPMEIETSQTFVTFASWTGTNHQISVPAKGIKETIRNARE